MFGLKLAKAFKTSADNKSITNLLANLLADTVKSLQHFGRYNERFYASHRPTSADTRFIHFRRALSFRSIVVPAHKAQNS